MIKVGEYNTLQVIREAAFGVYLDDGADGILLPKRFVPEHTKIDDELTVFILLMLVVGLDWRSKNLPKNDICLTMLRHLFDARARSIFDMTRVILPTNKQ